MAGLSRRLRVIEERFGPAIVESPEPSPARQPWTPNQELEFSDLCRQQVEQLQEMAAAGEVDAEVARLEIARLKSSHPDHCSSCDAWPILAIGVEPDGSVRCGHCGVLMRFLPPRDCQYFGHARNCQCDYDLQGELRGLWFFDLLQEVDRQALLDRWTRVWPHTRGNER